MGVESSKGTARPDGWRRKYATSVVTLDSVSVFLATFLAWIIRFNTSIWVDGSSAFELPDSRLATVLVVCLSLGWIFILFLSGSWALSQLGAGADEYRNVVRASVLTFALAILTLFALNIPISRIFLGSSFAIGLLLLVLERWLLRKFLVSVRSRNRNWSDTALLIGSRDACIRLSEELTSRFQAGFVPIAACIVGPPSDSSTELRHDNPLQEINKLFLFDDFEMAVSELSPSVVIVAEGGGISPDQLRDLTWKLNPLTQKLILAPALIDVSGPRIHSRPVAGLPFVFVEVPSFMGFTRAMKRSTDLLLACAGFLFLMPIFAAIAVAIKLDDGGPVFFSQERVGLNEKKFRMLKFRSMVVNAEMLKAELVAGQSSMSNNPLFKLKTDPRITRTGQFLRKWSLDELPQILNVIQGNMSLVGPRPPLESEVMKYESFVNRKFLVKPGITGLWQVSGRSDLPWTESVKLDLYYVENWSLALDLIILARTFSAVISRRGAY